MKKIIGYTIFTAMAGAVQAALVIAAMKPGPENYMPLVFEGFVALFVFAAWCVS